MAKKPIKDENGKIIWKNLIYMDLQSFIFLVIVVILILAYKHDTQVCSAMAKNPTLFCEGYKCQNCLPYTPVNETKPINISGGAYG